MTQVQSQDYANSDTSSRHRGKCFVRNAVAVALGVAFLGGIFAQQGSPGSAVQSATAAEPDVAHLVISGSTGTVGMDADHADELIIVDGNFHSRECSKLGFRKSEARVERDGDVIRFSAVNVSPKYGTLSWEGVIRDGVVQALYVWEKKRMFWTIQRKYWFSGAVKNGAIKIGSIKNGSIKNGSIKTAEVNNVVF